MAAEWYYAKGEEKHGPVSEDRLRALAESGELLPSDRVWRKETKGWVDASSVPGLFPDDVPPLVMDGSDATPDWWQQLWSRVRADKLVFLVVCFLISFFLFLVSPFLFGTTTRDTGFSKTTGPSDAAVFVGTVFGLASLGLFVAVVVMAILRFRHKFAYMSLSGKWHPVDGRDEPLEFSGLNTVTRGDSLAGTYVVRKDKSMEVTSGGKVVEVWQLVKVDNRELVIRDASGAIKRFKKKTSNPLAALFDTRRITHLEGSWQPLTEASEWVQFTKDGAVVFSDGTAGRYTVVGEEPNEVIEMEMVDGLVREFRVVSLTPTQLVIAEGTEATTFRRLRTGSGKRRAAGVGTGTAPSPEGSEPDDEGGGTATKGIVGGLFSFFFRYKCPKCGHRSGKKQSSRIVDSRQEVRSLPENGELVQRVVDLTLWEYTIACQDCGHRWCERSTSMGKA